MTGRARCSSTPGSGIGCTLRIPVPKGWRRRRSRTGCRHGTCGRSHGCAERTSFRHAHPRRVARPNDEAPRPAPRHPEADRAPRLPQLLAQLQAVGRPVAPADARTGHLRSSGALLARLRGGPHRSLKLPREGAPPQERAEERCRSQGERCRSCRRSTTESGEGTTISQ
jgi:hypothetical protein